MRSIRHLAEKRENRTGLERGQIVFFFQNQLQRLDTILSQMVDYRSVEHMRFASRSMVETRHQSRGKSNTFCGLDVELEIDLLIVARPSPLNPSSLDGRRSSS
jgi:hypothetical protein